MSVRLLLFFLRRATANDRCWWAYLAKIPLSSGPQESTRCLDVSGSRVGYNNGLHKLQLTYYFMSISSEHKFDISWPDRLKRERVIDFFSSALEPFISTETLHSYEVREHMKAHSSRGVFCQQSPCERSFVILMTKNMAFLLPLSPRRRGFQLAQAQL